MKNRLVILLSIVIGIPFCLSAQKRKWINYEPNLWVTAGYNPLKRGLGINSTAQMYLLSRVGFNFQMGYGYAHPELKDSNLYNYHSRNFIIGGGIMFKSADTKRGKNRKLNFIAGSNLVYVHGQERANLYFKGIDFDDYISSQNFKQKFELSSLQFTAGLSYRLKEKWRIEICINSNSFLKQNIGSKYFHLSNDYSLYLNNKIGYNLSVGYILWKPKSKK